MDSKHLIELIDISKDYNGDVALDHVNLYINDGEFLTLLGPSVCGKTTLLRCIAGFITPSSGMIKMNEARDQHGLPKVRVVPAPQRA